MCDGEFTMRKIVSSFAANLLWLSSLAFSANATDLKIIVENETDKSIVFQKSVTNYSYFPGHLGTELIDLEPKQKEEFALSIYSSSYFDIFDKDDESKSVDKINFQVLEEEDGLGFDNYIYWTLKENMQFLPQVHETEFGNQKYLVELSHKPHSSEYMFIVKNKK